MTFTYWQCPVCEFDAVLADGERAGICPLCAGDNGRDVTMRGRPATAADKPEGVDARTTP